MLLCLQLRGIYAHGIMLTRCVNVTVANITMHNVGMFFVIDWNGHGNRVSKPLQCLNHCISLSGAPLLLHRALREIERAAKGTCLLQCALA